MSLKRYAAWHARKASLNDAPHQPYFFEREVWWAAIGCNVGDEEDGKGRDFARPVLIVRKFNRSLFYGLPLSAARKRGPYYHELLIKGERRTALLSHLRDYDAKRLINKLGTIDETAYARVQLALILLLRQPARPRSSGQAVPKKAGGRYF